MAKSKRIGRRAIAVWLAAALLAGGTTAGAAQPVEFEVAEGTRFTMQVPKGFCQFDPKGHDADRKYFASTAEDHRPDNKLVAVFADCAAVNATRAAYPNGPYPSLERWVQVLVPLAEKQPRKLSGASRTEVIEMLARFQAADRSVSLSHALRDIELARPGSDEAKQLGVLAKDQLALISGVLVRSDEDGKRSLIAGATGMTLIGSYVLSINDFRTFARRDTYDALVAEIRAIVGDLIERNEKK